MRPQRTFEAITRALQDGAWHTVEDLRQVARFPIEWVEELQAEGILETTEQVEGHLLIRLNPGRLALAV